MLCSNMSKQAWSTGQQNDKCKSSGCSAWTLPKNFAGLYDSEDALNKEQKPMVTLQCQKRKGILGVFSLCIEIRYRILDGQIGNLRECGVYTTATVVLRGIDLHPEDEEFVKKQYRASIDVKAHTRTSHRGI